jgi:hypothetical protein
VYFRIFKVGIGSAESCFRGIAFVERFMLIKLDNRNKKDPLGLANKSIALNYNSWDLNNMPYCPQMTSVKHDVQYFRVYRPYISDNAVNIHTCMSNLENFT